MWGRYRPGDVTSESILSNAPVYLSIDERLRSPVASSTSHRPDLKFRVVRSLIGAMHGGLLPSIAKKV